MNTFLSSLLAVLCIQVVFFIIAASWKTDKVTDLSYGLTFILLGVLLFTPSSANNVLLLLLVLWGVRLAGYLFFRILHMKKDRRFDGIREHFWKFAGFWTLQGFAIWIISLPFIVAFNTQSAFAWWHVPGILIWSAGFIIETVADHQKWKHKSTHPNELVQIGLWKYSRHPNYFGEILVWTGIFLYTLPGGWAWWTVLSPVFITFLLLRVTGVPQLDAAWKKKYGKAYVAYKKKTRLLVPLK